MQLYSCAYDYCANVSGDPNAKANELPKPSKKPIKSANGKQGLSHCMQLILGRGYSLEVKS